MKPFGIDMFIMVVNFLSSFGSSPPPAADEPELCDPSVGGAEALAGLGVGGSVGGVASTAGLDFGGSWGWGGAAGAGRGSPGAAPEEAKNASA
jgi:hypothetical protein